jgi:hypothetical protein
LTSNQKVEGSIPPGLTRKQHLEVLFSGAVKGIEPYEDWSRKGNDPVWSFSGDSARERRPSEQHAKQAAIPSGLTINQRNV